MTDVLGFLTQCERCGQRAITLAPHNDDWVCPRCAEFAEPPLTLDDEPQRDPLAELQAIVGDVARAEAPTPGTKPRRDTVEHTCEICGRVGTRRYVATDTGWKCSPTATACAPRFRPPGSVVSSPADKPAESPAPAPPTSNITARCKDCTRTFTLTGRPLILAVDMHEMKHSHIVHIIESAAS